MSVSLHPAIVASIPGRLRLRDPRLRRRAVGSAAVDALREIEGVLSVEANPAAGSVLLRYAPAAQDRAAMEARVAAAVAALLPAVPAVEPPVASSASGAVRLPASFRRSPLHAANRAAKIGMLAALPVSLGFVAAGNRQIHAVAGAAFTLMLLVHLAMHRRRLTQ